MILEERLLNSLIELLQALTLLIDSAIDAVLLMDAESIEVLSYGAASIHSVILTVAHRLCPTRGGVTWSRRVRIVADKCGGQVVRQ